MFVASVAVELHYLYISVLSASVMLHPAVKAAVIILFVVPSVVSTAILLIVGDFFLIV